MFQLLEQGEGLGSKQPLKKVTIRSTKSRMKRGNQTAYDSPVYKIARTDIFITKKKI